jgi:hypothetical protein
MALVQQQHAALLTGNNNNQNNNKSGSNNNNGNGNRRGSGMEMSSELTAALAASTSSSSSSSSSAALLSSSSAAALAGGLVGAAAALRVTSGGRGGGVGVFDRVISPCSVGGGDGSTDSIHSSGSREHHSRSNTRRQPSTHSLTTNDNSISRGSFYDNNGSWMSVSQGKHFFLFFCGAAYSVGSYHSFSLGQLFTLLFSSLSSSYIQALREMLGL